MTFNNNFVAEVKCNGRILRVTDGYVRLPFGSEYSILLKNLDTRRASVRIHIDGDDVLDGHSLVLNPNETTELQGFMKGNAARNRFKFIEKTEQISEYRGDKIDDGMIRIEFGFEQQLNKIRQIINEHHEHHYHHHHHDWDWWYPRRTVWYDSGVTFTINNSDGSNYQSSAGDLSKKGIMPDQVTGQSDSFDIEPLSYDHQTQAMNCSFNDQDLKTPVNDLGITVKGSEVNQQFSYTSMGQLEDSGVIIIHLKGETKTGQKITQPVTTKTKLTCSTCGKSSKSSNKYCPNCGTFLE